MEFGSQIKKYRTDFNLSQEELAAKIYVTRQTISNWENGKSYPDMHSLLLLSSLFNISIDFLVKGDINTMKKIINEHERNKLNYYGKIFTIHLIVLIATAVPLFMWLEKLAHIPFRIMFIITMYWAIKTEMVKHKNDIKTYKEIVAFSEGKSLDEIQMQIEKGKRPYQSIIKIELIIIVTVAFCFLIGLFMHFFLN